MGGLQMQIIEGLMEEGLIQLIVVANSAISWSKTSNEEWKIIY
jgi:hypothetical protein